MTMLRFSKKFFFFCLILKLCFSSFYCQLLKSSFFHFSLINWIFLSSLYWKFLLIYEVIVKSSGFFFTSLSWSLLWRLALPLFPFDSSFLLWLLWNCFPLDVFILLHLWLLLSFLHQCFLSSHLSNKSIFKVLPCSFTSLFFVISFSLQLPFLFLIDSQSI